MKKTSNLFSILLLLTLGFAGCMKMDGYGDYDQDRDPKKNHIAPVIFQYEYYNYAWGFRHSGFLIDKDGRIKGFNQPENWITPDSSGFMAKEDLKYNLAKCDTISGRVDLDELYQYASKIKGIRNGKIVDHGSVMADAGTGVFSAWYWNDKVGKFENVFLISNGDMYKVNRHEDVSELVAWLKWIGEKTDRFWWYGGE